MRSTPAEAITKFLSFSATSKDAVPKIAQFSPREWKHGEQWLNDSGIAFYFLQRVKDTNVGGAVPTNALSRIERNFASNHARVDDMAVRFNELNQRFEAAGIRYEVVKGFSLVPHFCPCAPLRYQADFDYLVDEDCLSAARRVLIEAGYQSRESLSRQETVFVTPNAKPSRGDTQYSPQAPHAVELHTDIWDNEMHGLQPIAKLFCVDQAEIRHWNGFSFPAQRDEDAFLLQVLHACRHLFTQWIRLSCVFEIAYFLNRRWSDIALWSRVEQRLPGDALVREFVVVVAELAKRLFAAPMPPLIQSWEVGIRPELRVWIEHYSRNWALCELPAYELCFFPSTKLVLFLQKQYRRPPDNVGSNGRSAASRFQRFASSIRTKPSLVLSREWRENTLLLRRGLFWSLAQARYVCEIPRWWWLCDRATRERPLS